MMKTWSKRITDWAEATFGVPTPDRALDRFRDELKEFEQADSDEAAVEEAADIVITLCNYACTLGFDLAEVVYSKEYVNSQRAWKSNGDGTGKHIKDPEHDMRSKQAWERFRAYHDIRFVNGIRRYARVESGDDVKDGHS